MPAASPMEERDLERRREAAAQDTVAEAEREGADWNLREREERRRRRPPLEAERSGSEWERGRDWVAVVALIFWTLCTMELIVVIDNTVNGGGRAGEESEERRRRRRGRVSVRDRGGTWRGEDGRSLSSH